jgi:hypothetical protein
MLSSSPIIYISAKGTRRHLAIWIKPIHLEHGSNLVKKKGLSILYRQDHRTKI